MEVFWLGDGDIGKRVKMDKICDMTGNLDSRDLCINASGRCTNQKTATCHIGANVNGQFVNLVDLEE